MFRQGHRGLLCSVAVAPPCGRESSSGARESQYPVGHTENRLCVEVPKRHDYVRVLGNNECHDNIQTNAWVGHASEEPAPC